MEKIKLPKLRKINLDRPKKKKILLLSDDIRFRSGIATMSREIIVQTAEHYDWVQLGAGVNHPDKNKIFDVSEEIDKAAGIDHSSVKIYAFDGYGNPQALREILERENPDAIMFFTDPRFWGWLFQMEHELRQRLPLIYYNIWDAPPTPIWNLPYYSSCDLIMNISRQTHALVHNVLDYGKSERLDISEQLN